MSPDSKKENIDPYELIRDGGILEYFVRAKRENLFEFFFEEFAGALYVLDVEKDTFVMVNQNFANLVGYTREELLSGEIKSLDLLADKENYKKRKNILSKKSQRIKLLGSEVYQMTFLTKQGEKIEVEITVKRKIINNRVLSFGQAKEISAFKTRFLQLEKEVELKDEYMRKVRDKRDSILRANMRLMQITERIIKTPEFSRHLEACVEDKELYENTVTFLASPLGMEFGLAAIYMFDKARDRLKIAACAGATEALPKIIELNTDNLLARLALKKTNKLYLTDGTIAVPLKRKQIIEGILVVQLYEIVAEMLNEETSLQRLMADIITNFANLIMFRKQNIELIQDLRKQSIIDQLTGIYNRRYFDEKLRDEFARAKRYNRELSLMIIDLDRFKEINDTYLHQQGDLLLQEFAAKIKAKTREVDFFCRVGGDEFAIILPETSLDNAILKAEDLRLLIAESSFTNMKAANKPLYLTISVGVAAVSSGAKSFEELYRLADLALYDSKSAGRNVVNFR